MPLLTHHEPGTTEARGAWDFLLPDLSCRFSPAERRETAAASDAERALFFLIGDTTYSGVNLNRFWQFKKIALLRRQLFFENRVHWQML